ncbi:Holliday junction branch migration protein RuvA [bacterium]|jgi:holliday junction DNA helicase RuvA|nr:Holliday junction branch migration protein RuvA [bacterium]MBT4121574.1 Holliday junction branch migration protein RuvA [bacterium]MBT4335721.1 Holliday junction branch migration protein RuvA [bacterium]MBT4495381.1 Holliday junction branch migration protein RuvA [bacterium]MBT4763606.1 Holliday junction branch migration protein RuvA [bacterium]
MISYLKGKILHIKSSYLILEVNNIGYQVFFNNNALNSLNEGDDIKIYTHHQIKEDLDDLYGFLTLPELELFKLVISISGVGPKSGLNVLATATVEEIIQAILSENPELLKSASGIGIKTAERLVIELKSKIGKLGKELTGKDIKVMSADNEVIEALISLGYSRNEVMVAVRGIDKDIKDISEKIKAALKILGK